MISELSIIIPVYNEEKRILKGLNEIVEYCQKNIEKWEILVINDGSTDNTEKLAEMYLIEKCKKYDIKQQFKIITYEDNRGKGLAVKAGMLFAQYQYRIYMDIDLSTPLTEIEKILKYKDKYDIIIGSRNFPNSKVQKQGTIRSKLGQIFPILTQRILKLNIKDTQCGFKLFNEKATKTCFHQQKINGWAFDAEILYIAKQNKLKIKEVGVEWNNDKRTKLNIITDPIKMLTDLYRIKRLH